MTTPQQLAKHFRDVFFGKNWTAVNLKDTLADVTLQEATTQVHGLNTIALLVFHIHYYVNPVLKVLQGGPLVASDKFSFDLQPLASEAEWRDMVDKVMADAELFAQAVEAFPEERLFDDFSESKYGTFYRNIFGIVEHTHYHLGQISLIKKMVKE